MHISGPDRVGRLCSTLQFDAGCPVSATARLFKLANSQAVRIPARYRIDADEVVITRGDDGALILRPKPRTAAEVFARARTHGADWSDWKRPDPRCLAADSANQAVAVADIYLLDACVVIAAMKAEPRALFNRLALLAPERLHVSAIALCELLTGAGKSHDAARQKAGVAELAAAMTPLPFDAGDALAYARIRTALERKGVTIGPTDLLLAAQAVARGLVLVSDNVREFRRVPGLRCENWLR